MPETAGTLRLAATDELAHPTRHSSTPSSAVTMSPRDPTGVRSMFIRCASVAPSAAGTRASARASSSRPQHHHAVLDVAVAAVEHGKAFDRALAAGFGDEIRHRPRLRSASACTLVSCASVWRGACGDSTSA